MGWSVQVVVQAVGRHDGEEDAVGRRGGHGICAGMLQGMGPIECVSAGKGQVQTQFQLLSLV